MKHQEYLKIIKEKTENIKPENILFWDLWCLNYVFEKLDTDYRYYPQFRECFELLWNCQDQKIDDFSTLSNNSSISTLLNFNYDDFQDLNDFNVEEKAAKEMIIGLEAIFQNLLSEGKVTYLAHENAINLIDVEIDGISISENNTHPIYLEEVSAQMKLIDALRDSPTQYTYENRNIFR